MRTRPSRPSGTSVSRRLLACGLLACALAAGVAQPGRAHAAPNRASVALVRLPPQDLDALRREVAKARAVDERPFAELGKIVARAPEMNARARARKAPLAFHVAKLGPGALMPALEMLALQPPLGLPAEEMTAIRRDLMEAVGLLRDPRALKVLFAVMEDTSTDVETTRTATEAVARIGTDTAADAILAALARTTSDERTRALLAGMGECRRLRVTEALAERLRTTNDEQTARVAARALGRAGNAWVWPALADRHEEARIRETAARALVDAYVRHTGEARTATSNALMVVDAPETLALIAAAKTSATPEAARALDELGARFARNPARTR